MKATGCGLRQSGIVGTRSETKPTADRSSLSRRQRLAPRSRVDRDLDFVFLDRADHSRRRRLRRLSSLASSRILRRRARRRSRHDRAHPRGRRCSLSSTSIRVSDRTETIEMAEDRGGDLKLLRFAVCRRGWRSSASAIPVQPPRVLDAQGPRPTYEAARDIARADSLSSLGLQLPARGAARDFRLKLRGLRLFRPPAPLPAPPQVWFASVAGRGKLCPFHGPVDDCGGASLT